MNNIPGDLLIYHNLRGVVLRSVTEEILRAEQQLLIHFEGSQGKPC